MIVASRAEKGLKCLLENEPKAYAKSFEPYRELYEYPLTGTGKPELLSGDRSGQWSRRISKKHRLVYEIQEANVIVLVLTAFGHYGNK